MMALGHLVAQHQAQPHKWETSTSQVHQQFAFKQQALRQHIANVWAISATHDSIQHFSPFNRSYILLLLF